MTTWRALPVLIPGLLLMPALLAAALPACADGSCPEKQLEDAQTAHVAALAELSAWCQKKKIFGKRDEVCERILRFDADHADARRRLKYEKQDGAWVQHPRYRRPSNHSRTATSAFHEKYALVVGAFDGARHAILDGCRSIDDLIFAQRAAATWAASEPGHTMPPGLLRRIRLRSFEAFWRAGRDIEMDGVGQALRETYPGDDTVRQVMRETVVDGQQVLIETQAALGRGPKQQVTATSLVEAVPAPTSVELVGEELGLALEGLQAFTTTNLRVIGTAEEKQLVRIARLLEAAGPLFAQLLAETPKRRKDMRVFVFSGKGEVDTFLDRIGSQNEALVAQREKHALDIFWLDGRTLVVDAILPAGQADLATSMLMFLMLADTWFEGAPPGWVEEGVSRHATYLLTGTRMTIGVAGRYGSGDRVVPESYHDWIAKAQAVTAKTKRLDLRLLLGKRVDAYTVRDSILAYAFAVYLIEGLGPSSGEFLAAVGQGTDVDAAARAVFDMPLAVMTSRFRHWLDQMTLARKSK